MLRNGFIPQSWEDGDMWLRNARRITNDISSGRPYGLMVMERLTGLAKLVEESRSLPFHLSPKMLNKFTEKIRYSIDALVSKSMVFGLEKNERTRVKNVRRKEAKRLKKALYHAL